MKLGYCAGAVWTGQIDFADGTGARKKYFVLLNDCAATEQFFAAITTSQPRYAVTPSPCGCPTASCYRIEPGEVNCFPARTWIQFDNPGHLSHAGIDSLASRGEATFVQMLDEDRTRSILACAKKCIDIPQRDLVLIERTLKAKLAQRKTVAERNPPPTLSPSLPPSTADREVLAVRSRFNIRCAKCRSQFAELIGIPEEDLARIFLGAKLPPTGFASEAEAGLEIVGTCADCVPS